MGTRGLKIIRFRGKYYVFYNELDSYPEELGRKIVANIPADPQGYQVWLEKKRSRYSKTAQLLEDRVLSINNETPLSDRRLDRPSMPNDGTLNRLDQLPSPLPDIVDGRFEWTYIIDLDEEIFSVNLGAHFKLNNIPRDDVWIKALKEDAYNRMTISTDICPAAAIACPAVDSTPDDKTLCRYGRKFQGFSRSVVEPKADLDPDSEGVHGQIFSVLMFVEFCDQYWDHLASFALEWRPDDFVFRELAFAMISLASGQVLFCSSLLPACGPNCCIHRDYDHRPSRGYIVAPNKNLGFEGSQVLPEFAIGSHRPGEEPGSAPLDTMYWFEDVLICLATSLDKYDVFDATIARTVKHGIKNGRKNFQAVILSLMDLILVEVCVEDMRTVVKHSDLIVLFPIWPEDHLSIDPTKRPLFKGGKHLFSKRHAITRSGLAFRSIEKVYEFFGGFSSLVLFFETATNRRLKPSSHDQSRFPVELYQRILDFTDDMTYLSCAKVSRIFRAYCQKNFRVGRKIVTKYHDPMEFTFIDREAGSIAKWRAVHRRGYHKRIWSPIVGLDRPSILSKVSLAFTSAGIPSEKDSEGEGTVVPLMRPLTAQKRSRILER